MCTNPEDGILFSFYVSLVDPYGNCKQIINCGCFVILNIDIIRLILCNSKEEVWEVLSHILQVLLSIYLMSLKLQKGQKSALLLPKTKLYVKFIFRFKGYMKSLFVWWSFLNDIYSRKYFEERFGIVFAMWYSLPPLVMEIVTYFILVQRTHINFWLFYYNPAVCPDPGAPAHGKRLNDDFRDGKLVAFECNHNYDLWGSKTITCNGGVWSGNTPQCKGNSRIINRTSRELHSIPCC